MNLAKNKDIQLRQASDREIDHQTKVLKFNFGSDYCSSSLELLFSRAHIVKIEYYNSVLTISPVHCGIIPI